MSYEKVNNTVDDNYVQNITESKENYVPTSLELKHITYLYKRKEEMKLHMESMGLFTEWKKAETLYINNQKEKEKNKLPSVNIATEIELIETKGAEEKRVMPEVILSPILESDRTKVEALQELLENIKIKNKDSLLSAIMIDNKNIKGISYQKIYWKETFKDVKIINDIEEDEEEDDSMIPKLKWTTYKVKKYNDICIENIPETHLLFSENATMIEDSDECFHLFFGTYAQAKERFGNYSNFKYISSGKYATGMEDEINKSFKYTLDELKEDVTGFMYYNTQKDEYSIVLNGVLLTQYDEQGGNPIPTIYFKDHPFTRAVCRYIPGDREFHSKGDVMLINRLKEIKNTLVNAVTKGVVTNASAVLLASKEIIAFLRKNNLSWNMASALPVSSKESSQATKVLSIEANVAGVLEMIKRIDEMITTITGIDSRSLLTSVQETATKTAVRQETMVKRIDAGLKLIENDTFYRKTQIMLALIKQFYEEEEEYIDEADLGKEKPNKVKRQKYIPVNNKTYSWSEEIEPFSQEELSQLTMNGVNPEFIASIIRESKDGFKLNYNIEEIKSRKDFLLMNENIRNLLIKTIKNKTKMSLNSENVKKGLKGSLPIRKELFNVDFEIEILPKGINSYSDLHEKERSDELTLKYLNNPYVNQPELIAKDFELNNINPENFVKTDQQVQQEQQAQMEQEAQMQAQANPQTQGEEDIASDAEIQALMQEQAPQ